MLRDCLIIVVGLGTLIGCAPGLEEDYVDFGRVRMYYEPAYPPCKGAPEYLNSVAARQADFIGVTLPDQIIYHFRPSGNEFPCPSGAGGCTDPTTKEIWSYRPDHTHELVHALQKPSVSFFAEGEAVALGGLERSGNPNYDVDIDNLIGQSRLGYEHYRLAGDFVSYLLAVHGPARFSEFLAKVPDGCTAAVTRAAFNETYNQSIEEAIAERLASGMVFADNRLSFPECSASPEPWQGDRWEVSKVVGCNESGTGPIDTHAVVDSAITLDVPIAGFYGLSIEANAGALQIQQCTTKKRWEYVNTEGPPSGLGGRTTIVFMQLDAVQYYMHLRSQDGRTASMRVALARTLAASSDCKMADVWNVDSGSDGIYLAPDMDEQMFAHLAVDRPRNATTVIYQSDLRICVDDCDMSNCLPLAYGDPIKLEPNHVYTLIARSENRGRVSGLALLN